MDYGIVSVKGFGETQRTIGEVRNRFKAKHIHNTPVDFLSRHFNGSDDELLGFLTSIGYDNGFIVSEKKAEQFKQYIDLLTLLKDAVRSRVQGVEKFDPEFLGVGLKSLLKSQKTDESLVTYELEYDFSNYDHEVFESVIKSVKSLDLSNNLYSYVSYEPESARKLHLYISKFKFYNLSDYFQNKIYDGAYVTNTSRTTPMVAPGITKGNATVVPYSVDPKAAKGTMTFNVASIDINRMIFDAVEKTSKKPMLLVTTTDGAIPAVHSQQYLNEPTIEEIEIINDYLSIKDEAKNLEKVDKNEQKGSLPHNESLNISKTNDAQVLEQRAISEEKNSIEASQASFFPQEVIDILMDNKDKLGFVISQLKTNLKDVLNHYENDQMDLLNKQIDNYNKFIESKQVKEDLSLELKTYSMEDFESVELLEEFFNKPIVELEGIIQTKNKQKTSKKQAKNKHESKQEEPTKPVEKTPENDEISSNNEFDNHMDALLVYMQKQQKEARDNYQEYEDAFIKEIVEHNADIKRASDSVYATSRNRFTADFVLHSVLGKVKQIGVKDLEIEELNKKVKSLNLTIDTKEERISDLEDKLSEAIHERDSVKSAYKTDVLNMKEEVNTRIDELTQGYETKISELKSRQSFDKVDSEVLKQKDDTILELNRKIQELSTVSSENAILKNTIEMQQKNEKNLQQQINNLITLLSNNNVANSNSEKPSSHSKPIINTSKVASSGTSQKPQADKNIKEERSSDTTGMPRSIKRNNSKKESDPFLKLEAMTDDTDKKEIRNTNKNLSHMEQRLQLANTGALNKMDATDKQLVKALVDSDMIKLKEDVYILKIGDDKAVNLLKNESLNIVDVVSNYSSSSDELEDLFEDNSN
jgi:hypothetical protein